MALFRWIGGNKERGATVSKITDEEILKVVHLRNWISDGNKTWFQFSYAEFITVARALLSHESEPSVEPGWMGIENAPKDKPILVFDAVCGPYISKFTDGEFPLGFWNYLGVWYPKPTHWRPLDAPADAKSEPVKET